MKVTFTNVDDKHARPKKAKFVTPNVWIVGLTVHVVINRDGQDWRTPVAIFVASRGVWIVEGHPTTTEFTRMEIEP